MSNCPVCGSEMDYVGRYGQWYCIKCQRYPFKMPQKHMHPLEKKFPPPPQMYYVWDVFTLGAIAVFLVITLVLSFTIYYDEVSSIDFEEEDENSDNNGIESDLSSADVTIKASVEQDNYEIVISAGQSEELDKKAIPL